MITREDLENGRINLSDVTTGKRLPAIHPGEILQADFLEPMGITQYRLAKDIGVSPRRVNEIIHGRRAITADTAIRFGQFFGTSANFWMNLQTSYELDRARAQIEESKGTA